MSKKKLFANVIGKIYLIKKRTGVVCSFVNVLIYLFNFYCKVNELSLNIDYLRCIK